MHGVVHSEQHVVPDRPDVRIMSVQPDREHAFVEVIGVCGREGVAELRQRLDGLMIAGARFVLVDLSGASAGRQLARRNGWLMTVGHDSASAARYEASLPDLFTMYQAACGRARSG